MSGGSSRVSIPDSFRKTIQNIKEIAGNHGDDEIYAMLKECSMDPNETAQRLLHQDTFHEVKRKRDKRKENIREPADTRWRPASQGRGGRGGRGNFSSRYVAHEAGGGRNVGKENGTHQGVEKGTTSASSPPSQDPQKKSAIKIASSVDDLSNGPTKTENQISTKGSTPEESTVNSIASVEERSVTVLKKMGTPPVDDVENSPSGLPGSSSNKALSLTTVSSDSGLCASASDPVLVPSLDARTSGTVGAIKREVGSQRSAVETTVSKAVSRDIAGSELPSLSGKGSSQMNPSYMHGRMQGKSKGFDGNPLPDSSQPVSSLSRTSSAGSRPSSNYSNRSQQLNGPQKVGPAKEWKPKSTNANLGQVSGVVGTSDVEPITKDTAACSLSTSSSTVSADANINLQKKLEELQLTEARHVIIPNHLQVPESERTGLSFGSFDANFGLTTRFVNDSESDKNSIQLSESSQDTEENVEEPPSSIQNASSTAQEAEYFDHSQPPEQMPENSPEKDPEVPSTIPPATECDQSNSEAVVAQEGSQYSVVHTAPSYSSFGLVPQMLGGQFASFEGAEPQARDTSRIPSFVVQQPFDPSTSYYTSMYRPTADGDGRFSPLLAPSATTKYNGNIAVLPTAQSPQESGNTLILPSTGSTPLGTQAAGAASQQSVPVFRQPAGVHISHYPPNYLPYSQYFSPFYVPPPTIHHFLSNAAFPQQPPTGGIYQPPGAAAGAAPVKYSISQYKPASNTGNPSHVGVPAAYGSYNQSAVASGNSTGSEDLSTSQYKENNVFISGQQSEGSAVWIPAPGRDISALQPTSFYNLPPQAQHMTYPGIYHHPTQAVAAGTVHPMLQHQHQQSQAMAGAVEMVGPPAGVYQQPQRTQINWVNNY